MLKSALLGMYLRFSLRAIARAVRGIS